MSNLDKLQQLNTNIPRETLVVATDGLVIKRPVIKPGGIPRKSWVEKQYHAQKVQDSLQDKSGKYYFIPKMLEISDAQMFAIEQRVPGVPVTDTYFETLGEGDRAIIYLGVAHFLNDINQSKPVLTQRDIFDTPEHPGDIAFARIVKHLRKDLTSKEIDILNKSKEWFDVNSANDASVVFCQGDMNQHNIFYDQETKTVSFIDFADARYENARDMFHRDIARLTWLNINKLIQMYKGLERVQPVITESEPTIARMRNALQNIKWTGAEVINANPKLYKARLAILKEEIAKLGTLLMSVKTKNTFEHALSTLNDNKKQK